MGIARTMQSCDSHFTPRGCEAPRSSSAALPPPAATAVTPACTHLSGWRASSMMGMTLGRDFAMLMRSRPERCENSTAYTMPVGPTWRMWVDEGEKKKGGGERRGVHT